MFYAMYRYPRLVVTKYDINWSLSFDGIIIIIIIL